MSFVPCRNRDENHGLFMSAFLAVPTSNTTMFDSVDEAAAHLAKLAAHEVKRCGASQFAIRRCLLLSSSSVTPDSEEATSALFQTFLNQHLPGSGRRELGAPSTAVQTRQTSASSDRPRWQLADAQIDFFYPASAGQGRFCRL